MLAVTMITTAILIADGLILMSPRSLVVMHRDQWTTNATEDLRPENRGPVTKVHHLPMDDQSPDLDPIHRHGDEMSLLQKDIVARLLHPGDGRPRPELEDLRRSPGRLPLGHVL